MEMLKPIITVDLFPSLGAELQSCLKSLSPSDWSKPTVCFPWTIKDVTAHLLGGSLGRLWKRDENNRLQLNDQPDFNTLLEQINHSNAEWVQAARRISPELLIELLDLTDRHLYEHFRRLDPFQLARITVAWASNNLPPNWFDIAREYTEKWLHQQHIREAAGQPLLLQKRWLKPVLETFVHALPYTYRGIQRRPDTRIGLIITGEAGGDWTLKRNQLEWELFSGRVEATDCLVEIDQDLAWRLFTRGISRQQARPQIHITGEESLGNHVLEMVSIMA